MKKLISFALAALLLLSMSVSAFALDDYAFDATLSVERTKTVITVTVKSDDATASILAEKQPVLSIPCNFAAAKVTFDGQTVDSVLKNGEICFTVAAGGTYQITKVVEPAPPYIEVPVVADKEEKEEDTPSEAVEFPFADVSEEQWYYDAVSYAFENDLMIGVSESEFDPAGTATRGMVLTMLARLAGEDVADSEPWYAESVAWAMEAGISDGTYPEAEISREQIITMLYRFAGAAAGDAALLAEFTDGSAVSVWAADAMAWAVENGILQGKGDAVLDPLGLASRAEIAAIFMRFTAI